MKTIEDSTPKSPKGDLGSPLQGKGVYFENSKKSSLTLFKTTFF